jgi:hypothetical protein
MLGARRVKIQGIPHTNPFVMVPRIQSFAARTFGAKLRPPVISKTHKASVQRSSERGCLTSQRDVLPIKYGM